MTIRSAVFAGGGARCFWQLGFWLGARQAGLNLNTSVTHAAGVSAGCAMVTTALLGREQEAFDLFVRLVERNPGNVHWGNLFSSAPLLPHAAMNREAMQTLLTQADLEVLQRLEVSYLMARYPRYLSGGLAALLAFSVYGLEKRISGRVHPRWTQRLGFTPLVAQATDADSPQALIEMMVGSSSVPPVLPCDGYRGEPVLDGGVIDNVPAFLADGRDGDTLVLLSKQYRVALPDVAGRLYVCPSEAIPLDKFNYADPDKLRWTFELGRADGQRFASRTSETPAA